MVRHPPSHKPMGLHRHINMTIEYPTLKETTMQYRQISEAMARKIVAANVGTMQPREAYGNEYVIPRRNGFLILEAAEDMTTPEFRFDYFLSRRT